jgi:glycogen synthase
MPPRRTDRAAYPRRVLLTADPLGGVWTYALELSRALSAAGCQITLASMGGPITAADRRDAERIPHVRLFQSLHRIEWMDDPWQDVGACGEWLLNLEQEVAPDLIHLNSYCHGALPWSAPVLMVGHSCVLSWWEAVKGEPAPSCWNRYATAVRRGLEAADLVVAPTAAMLANLQRFYGPLPRTLVIPNGCDLGRLRPLAKESFVLTAGRLWDEGKNVEALVRVAARLPWPVYVAGDIRHPDGHTTLPQRVSWLGRLSRPAMAEWFGRAGIYVLPARYEPFGLSAVEAALAGCALVVGDIPSLREIWQEAAMLVPPNDSDALAEVLTMLAADEGRRRELAACARERALRYSRERMANEYLRAYERLGTRVGAHGKQSPGACNVRLHPDPPGIRLKADTTRGVEQASAR